jgi:hypothetical protein
VSEPDRPGGGRNGARGHATLRKLTLGTTLGASDLRLPLAAGCQVGLVRSRGYAVASQGVPTAAAGAKKGVIPSSSRGFRPCGLAIKLAIDSSRSEPTGADLGRSVLALSQLMPTSAQGNDSNGRS